MEYTVTVYEQEKETKILTCEGKTLLEVLQSNGFTEPSAPCGGKGVCGKCMIMTKGRFMLFGETDDGHKKPRMSCRAVIIEDCSVWLTTQPKPSVLIGESSDNIQIGVCENLGVAVDIGTTTVAAYLYDLEGKKLINSIGALNNQKIYGADVISRIQFSSTLEGLQKLSAVIRWQLNDLITTLCQSSMQKTENIKKIAIAGNTVMEHIFAELSPESIGVAPFNPLSLFGTEFPASECGLSNTPNSAVYLLPAISGYVGGDVVAGLFSSGAYNSEDVSLFIDIGTNGEMALGNNLGFKCCATAAGPAFEGAEISCGMTAADGAINMVSFENGKLQYKTIGNSNPIGICGSGLVDTIAALLKKGDIDETGRLLSETKANGRPAFFISENVFITVTNSYNIFNKM